MVKKCPPGVICFENITIFFIFIVLFIITYLIYNQNKNNNIPIIIKENIVSNIPNHSNDSNNSNIFSNSVLLNPYVPPLKNNIPGIPINIKTQGFDSEYRQIGILTRINGSETILPLMGRSLITNRDKWNYYTMNDKSNMIKLPISYRGKSCTSEYGCDNIYNGDNVYVEGYNDAFKATIYDNDSLKYIPYL